MARLAIVAAKIVAANIVGANGGHLSYQDKLPDTLVMPNLRRADADSG